MQIQAVREYLKSTVKTPFFLSVSDGQYASVMGELSVLGLPFIGMSRFCRGDDKLPNEDDLFSHIKTADANVASNHFVLTGLGEYLAIRGKDAVKSVLSRLKDMNVGGAKVVLLLRGLASQTACLAADPRFDHRRFLEIDNADCNLSFTVVAPSIGLTAILGFKAMLANLENGRCGNVVVSTAMNFDKALFAVHKIRNAYEGINLCVDGFKLQRSCGNDEQWAQLLTELNQNDGLLDQVFEAHGLGNNLESNFYARVSGSDYCNWIYYICLKFNAETLRNSYLRYVLEKTRQFEEFSTNVLNAIIGIPHTDKCFDTFYQERKTLVEKYPESDIADYVVNNRRVAQESIYRLTDGTKVEREEIIAWLCQNGPIPRAEIVYPALTAYMNKYVFKCPELANLLTEYFEEYKRQKLYNVLEPAFLEKVDALAHSPRQFNRLPTRNEVLERLDGADTYLYWLDALGVEYLAFIEALIQKRGLSVSINIARAELPTITSINRGFFDSWQGHKEKNEELDDTKHSDAGGYSFTDNALPIHLVKELDIITAVVDKAATELALRHYKKFLIVSDHGASRLAVLRRKEEKYETDTGGEHSGRCCKLFEPYELPFAAEENGYLVLADYGRFKGSRAANVEVHGGASLEEVVVPIIELTLKNRSVTVQLVDEIVTVDFRTGMEVKLFFNMPVHDVSVVMNGKRYPTTQIGTNHYVAKLQDARRAGEYPADVYAGDDLIGKVIIKAQGKSAKVNDAFDDLF